MKTGLRLCLLTSLLACGDSPVEPEGPADQVRIFFTRSGQPAPVTRSIIPTDEPLPVAITLLLAGPTDAERIQGFTSFFHEQTAAALARIEIRPDSLAIIDFLDFSHLTPGAATNDGSRQLLGELNHTIFEFTEIKSIVYRFNGSCTRFWNWLARDCTTVRRTSL